MWIGGFILAAEMGGLAAAAVTHESVLRALAIPLAVAAVAAAVLRAGALDPRHSAGRRAVNTSGEQPAAPDAARTAAAGPAGSPSGQQPDARAGERAAADGASAHPAASGPDSQPYAWSWPLTADGAERAAAPVPAERGPAAPEPVRPGVVTVLQDHTTRAEPPRTADLSEFLGQVVIAQCPHCAGFRIGASTQPPDWLFGCHDCGQQWSWRPGTPWPEVHVRPGERRLQRPRRPS